MKIKKMLFSAVSAFIIVLILSAQTAQAGPDPATTMPKFVAQTLKAAGIKVNRIDNLLTVQNLVVLNVPSILQDWENTGMTASLVEPVDSASDDSLVGLDPPSTLQVWEDTGMEPFLDQSVTSASEDDLYRFSQFRSCLAASNFISELSYTVCELGPTDAGDLICKSRVLLDEVGDDIQCIYTFLCTPENDYCA